MSTIATLFVKLGLDAAEYKAGLQTAISQTGTAASKIGKGLVGAGKTATLGLTLPILGAAVAATKMASDLEQSIGGVEAIFEDSADTIFEFGKTSAESIGLSMNALNTVVAPATRGA